MSFLTSMLSLLRHNVLGLRWSHGMVMVVSRRMWNPCLAVIGLKSANRFQNPSGRLVYRVIV